MMLSVLALLTEGPVGSGKSGQEVVHTKSLELKTVVCGGRWGD